MHPDIARELQERLTATFAAEAEEHLGVLEADLDRLRASPAVAEAVRLSQSLFRRMHTLKGAARSVGRGDVERIAGACEATLRALEGRPIGPDGIDQMETALAELWRQLTGAPTKPPDEAGDEGRAAAPQAAADAGPPAIPLPPMRGSVAARRPTVRVEVDRLAQLGALAEGLLLPKLAAAENAREAARLAERLRRLRTETRRSRAPTGAAADSELAARLGEIERRLRSLAYNLRTEQGAIAGLVDALFTGIGEIRTVPAVTVLQAFPAMVRDLCRETGKEARWKLEGGDVAVDRAVLDRIKDPLIHLMRNAIDHGIEPPEARLAAGKPRAGTISLTIGRGEGDRIEMVLTDDGAGIATDAVRDAAIRARLVDRDAAAQLGAAEAAELIFRAGLSTSPVVTNLSGNGVGLAIVRETVERMEGQIRLESEPGAGTLIRLSLPATVATHRGLLVLAGGRTFLWPGEAIERVIGLGADELGTALSRGVHPVDSEPLPTGRLAAVLGLAAATPLRPAPALVAQAADRRGLVVVDDILGEQELLIKELQPPLLRVRNILSAGLLGTGQLVLVLRPADVLAGLGLEPGAVDGEGARRRRILVVDDSPTTRTMERTLFESAGYSVTTAADGSEGLAAALGGRFDAVVSDVDMPRMNGFEMTERIRSERRLERMPIVLVTALESREDRERGLRAGANAYVVKSTFDESRLLDIVGRLA